MSRLKFNYLQTFVTFLHEKKTSQQIEFHRSHRPLHYVSLLFNPQKSLIVSLI